MNASGPITRRGFHRRRTLLAGLGGKTLAQGFAGLGGNRRRICASRSRQDVCISRRPRPASGVSHRVVVCDRKPRRRQRHGLWRAMDPVSSGASQPGRRRKAGPTSRSGWAMPR